ncbi:MAG: efflux RND transporter permease subunit, partial [Bacteroidota bacterium]
IDLLKDISDSDPEGIKEIRLELKDNAYLLGLDLNTIMSQVRSGFFGSQVQRLQRGQDEIKVWVRYDRANRGSINDLDKMRIVTPSGERIPLREIVSYSIERGEVSINRLDGAREIQVTSDIKDSDAVGDVLENIRTNIIPEILSKYPSVKVSYEGQNRQAGKLVNSFYQIGPIILVLIFMTIAFTFRSYSQPFLLLSMIPLSLIGVAWGHWIHGFSLNALSLLGIIALIGITVNDGLVLISKLNSFLKEGMEFDKAIREAGKSRFRAIFLTSLTTIAGLAPLIMEKSRNAQFLIPMAISIAYGIAIATFLTLLVLPLLISLTNDFKVFFKWLVTGVKVSKHTVERAVIELEAEKTLEE